MSDSTLLFTVEQPVVIVYVDSGSGTTTLDGSNVETYGFRFVDASSLILTVAGATASAFGFADSATAAFTLTGTGTDITEIGDTAAGGFILDGTATESFRILVQMGRFDTDPHLDAELLDVQLGSSTTASVAARPYAGGLTATVFDFSQGRKVRV